MSPAPTPPSPRLRPTWALLRSVVLALGFCALYVVVDWRLSDPPRTTLSWSHILIGAALWCVAAVLLTRVARAGGRAASGE